MPINIHISGDSPDEVLSLMAGLVGGSRTTAPASPIRPVSDEHKHVPAAGEVEAEEPAEGVELDAHGHPWNEETYASTKTKTGSFFSSDRDRIRLKIRCDWAGDPPGELTMSATALRSFREKARSSIAAVPAIESPARSGREAPIAPDRRTTETRG